MHSCVPVASENFVPGSRQGSWRRKWDQSVLFLVKTIWNFSKKFEITFWIASLPWTKLHWLLLAIFLNQDRNLRYRNSLNETASKKLRVSTCHKRAAMLPVFWDAIGILFLDFLGAETKIDNGYTAMLFNKWGKEKKELCLWLVLLCRQFSNSYKWAICNNCWGIGARIALASSLQPGLSSVRFLPFQIF